MSNDMSVVYCTSKTYQITVEGKINASWSDWFSGMRIVSRKEADGTQVTIMSGLADQTALRGLLNQLWDLNFVLRSVQRVDPNQISNPK